MIIKSIEIENFLSYFGSGQNNRFQFREGPTIVIGQNMTGKSKLFDAFKWVLYDKAYNTKEEKWYTSSRFGADLINEYAKDIAKKNTYVSASVCLSFEYRKEAYRLTRTFRAKKTGTRTYMPDTYSDLQLTQVTGRQSNLKLLSGSRAQGDVLKMFPENLSEYFLLQGESISRLMGLGDKDAFHKALNDIGRIEVFERFKKYAKNVYNQCKREFESQAGADNPEIQEVSSQIDDKQTRITSECEILNSLLNERTLLNARIDKLTAQLKNIEECEEVVLEMEHLEKARKEKEDEKQQFIEHQKEKVLSIWSYAGAAPILKRFSGLYKEYQEAHKIPEQISQLFVEQMLTKETCLVCERPAKKGEKPYENIARLKNNKSLEKKVQVIHNLLTAVENAKPEVSEIPDQIADYYQKLMDREQEIEGLSDEWNLKDRKLDDIVKDLQSSNESISKEKIKESNPKKTKESLRDTEEEKQDLNGRIKEVQGRLQILKDDLHKLCLKHKSLVKKSDDRAEKQRMEHAEKIRNSSQHLYRNFVGQLVQDIEREANQCFEQMTEGNQGHPGRVCVNYDEREIYTMDRNGNRMWNINQANKVSLQISFVAAILKVSSRFWNTTFPFIADAPISVLGGDNKLSAVTTMIDMFDQSILIFKDDAQTGNEESRQADLIWNLVRTNRKIKNAYELTIEEEADNPNFQNTKIHNIGKK